MALEALVLMGVLSTQPNIIKGNSELLSTDLATGQVLNGTPNDTTEAQAARKLAEYVLSQPIIPGVNYYISNNTKYEFVVGAEIMLDGLCYVVEVANSNESMPTFEAEPGVQTITGPDSLYITIRPQNDDVTYDEVLVLNSDGIVGVTLGMIGANVTFTRNKDDPKGLIAYVDGRQNPHLKGRFDKLYNDSVKKLLDFYEKSLN